jgi:ABC-2 type transport system ATP-binding protein
LKIKVNAAATLPAKLKNQPEGLATTKRHTRAARLSVYSERLFSFGVAFHAQGRECCVDGARFHSKNGYMAQYVIETEELSKEYPYGFLNLKKKTSLEGLNLQVEQGEVFGFLGPNGAGKSTTIKLLMKLIFPTSGTARILGKSIEDVSMHQDVGYLPEQPYFYDYLTAAEVLNYFARFHRLTATDRRARVDRMLKKVGLETAKKIQLRKYSKGMLQRVGMAQAILHDPQVVVLDEPMSGLDPLGRREVRDIILELKKEGRTVLFSTHILSDAETLCDRVGVIVGGKLRGVGTPGEIVGIAAHGMEILFEFTGQAKNLPLLSGATKTGELFRVQVAEPEVYATLDLLKAANARIRSVAQIKPTLEEFFVNLVAADRAQANAVEVSGK